jgi:hypothetical protein
MSDKITTTTPNEVTPADVESRIKDNTEALNVCMEVIHERFKGYLTYLNRKDSNVHLHTTPTKAELEGVADKIATEIAVLYGSPVQVDRNVVQKALFHFGKLHAVPAGFVGHYLSKVPGVDHVFSGYRSGNLVGDRSAAKLNKAVADKSTQAWDSVKGFFSEAEELVSEATVHVTSPSRAETKLATV